MSTYALLMVKATRKYFRENFDDAETANFPPFTVYSIALSIALQSR